MLFVDDDENEDWIWIDRGIDDRADHFKPCDACLEINRAMRDVADEPDAIWSRLELCPTCLPELETKSVQDALYDRRILNDDCDRTKLPKDGPWEQLFPFAHPEFD